LLSATGLAADEADLSVGGRDEAREAAPEVDLEATPEVGLDQLLVLPKTWSPDPDARQGGTAKMWRRRFADSDQAIRAAQKRIDQARQALDALSGGGRSEWQMAPPGAGANTDVAPMSIKQREEIRAGKLELERAERRRRALGIEADLAGVPESWRVPTSPKPDVGGG